MRIILDTGVFWRPEAMEHLRTAGQPLVMPAVVYLERLRQIRRDGHSMTYFEGILTRAAIRVEPFGAPQARRIADHVREDSTWNRLARDALVAAHVEAQDILVTTNPRDFHRLGFSEDQVIAV